MLVANDDDDVDVFPSRDENPSRICLSRLVSKTLEIESYQLSASKYRSSPWKIDTIERYFLFIFSLHYSIYYFPL